MNIVLDSWGMYFVATSILFHYIDNPAQRSIISADSKNSIILKNVAVHVNFESCVLVI